jgi:hypothetical protein
MAGLSRKAKRMKMAREEDEEERQNGSGRALDASIRHAKRSARQSQTLGISHGRVLRQEKKKKSKPKGSNKKGKQK